MEQITRSEWTVHQIRLDEIFFYGAISFDRVGDGVQPLRVPIEERGLFAPPLVEQASQPSGVRVGLVSSTRNIELKVAPYHEERQVDCVIDDELVETGVIPAGAETVRFTDLPEGSKRIELYLSQKAPMIITGLAIDKDATRQLLPERPRWLTYGSSITHAKAAASPAQTWSAIVARRRGLDLINLGYSGQCHLEPMVARLIRDQFVDFVSLCLGINVMGAASMNARIFRWAAIGMVKIIRERHPEIPIVVQSPIFSPSRETEPNAAGLCLVAMRAELQEAVALLQQHGDENIHYLDGLRILGPEHEQYLPDGLHPDADGYRLMADNFDRIVMEEMGIAKRLQRG